MRKRLLVLPLALLLSAGPLTGAAFAQGGDEGVEYVVDGDYAAYSPEIQTLMAFVHAQVGKQYVAGARGPGAFDCSGLTAEAYERIGIAMPAYSFTQARMGSAVRGEIRPGDLLFMVGGQGTPQAFGHVAIATSATTMISAANPRVGVHEVRIPSGLNGVRRFVS